MKIAREEGMKYLSDEEKKEHEHAMGFELRTVTDERTGKKYKYLTWIVCWSKSIPVEEE